MDPIITEINIPKLVFSYSGKDTIDAHPVGGGGLVQANRYLYRVRHGDGWIMDIGFLDFNNGSKDVRCFDYSDKTPPQLHRLKHGMRMSVKSEDAINRRSMNGRFWSELSQARIKKMNTKPVWSNLGKANEQQLDNGSGFFVRKFLKSIKEVEDFSTREAVLGDDHKRRNYLCALYKLDTLRAPLSCYTITRILPLLNYYQ